MKKLQNNFTTPEQSKRLLELGVPEDSADMLWDGTIDANEGWVFEDFPTYSDKPFSYYQSLYRQEDAAHTLPCWSVGRLIEIYNTCVDFDLDDGAAIVIFTQIESPMVQIIEMFEDKVGIMDFSKLEE